MPAGPSPKKRRREVVPVKQQPREELVQPATTSSEGPAAAPPPAAVPPPFIVPNVPSAWREQGYLVLVVGVRAGEIHYLSTLDGSRQIRFAEFARRMRQPDPPIDPYRLALNLWTRAQEGTFDLRVRDERKLLTMLTKEHLLQLSERELARAYKSVMGTGPDRIRVGSGREKYVDEMLARANSAEAPSAAAPTPQSAEQPEQDMTAKTATKKVKEPKPAKAPKAPKEPKPAKEPKSKGRAAPTRVASGENPFRAGTMKAKAFDHFVKSRGDRKTCVEHMRKLGAKDSSASSWYSYFVKIAPAS